MNSDKDIKKFLEENENLVVPEGITKGIDSTLNKIRKGKDKKRKKYMIAAATFLIILGVSVYGEGSVGAAIHRAVTSMESFFGDNFNGQSLEDYKTVVGTTADNKGVKVTLNDFFMEDNRIYINVTLNSKDIDDYAENLKANIFINGKKMWLADHGRLDYRETSRDEELKNLKNSREKQLLLEYGIDAIDVGKVKDIKVNFYNVIALKKEYINKPFDMNINPYVMFKDIKGKWDFSFSYDGEKIAKDIKEYNVDKIIDIDNFKIHMKSIRVSPTSVIVRFKEIGEYTGQPFFGVLNKDEYINDMVQFGRSEYEEGYSDNRINMGTINMDKLTIVPYIESQLTENMPKLENKYYKDKAVTIDLK